MLGSRTPRIDISPTFGSTFGEEAALLAEMADLRLDPWQRDTIDQWLALQEDGRWAAFEAALIVPRQNGKSQLVAACLLTHLLLISTPLSLYSAHQVKTSLEIFRNAKHLISALEERGVVPRGQIKVTETNGSEGFEHLGTGARLKFVARSKSSGRGFSADCIVIDEAFEYTSAQHAALMPTMLARKNPQIIYLSTPPLDGDSGEVLFDLRRRATKAPGPRFAYREWGVEGDLGSLPTLNLDDRKLWAQANPAYNLRISEEAIALERASAMPDVDFAREQLCIWPRRTVGGGAINLGHWAALLDSESRRDGAVTLGVDITPAQDYAAIVLYGHRTDGLGHVQLVDYRPGTDWIVPRLRELSDALSPMAICAGRGTYATLKTALAEDGFRLPRAADVGATGDVVTVAGADMTAATGQILEAVRQGSFRHVGRRELDAAIAGAVTRQTGDSIAWSRKDAASDITPLVAFTLAKWIYEVRAPLLNYDVLQSVF